MVGGEVLAAAVVADGVSEGADECGPGVGGGGACGAGVEEEAVKAEVGGGGVGGEVCENVGDGGVVAAALG